MTAVDAVSSFLEAARVTPLGHIAACRLKLVGPDRIPPVNLFQRAWGLTRWSVLSGIDLRVGNRGPLVGDRIMDRIELIRRVRSGVLQILLERAGERVATGSGFLVNGGVITNSHVLRDAKYDAVMLRPADTNPQDPASYVRLLPETVAKAVAAESPESEEDFVFLRLWEPEFNGRYVFTLSDSSGLAVGEEIVFLGFPFGMAHLTAHVGYLSSIYASANVRILQIDGSINGGNSGGPLIDLKTGEVAAVVTRAETGLIKRQFDELFKAFRANREAVDGPGRPRIRLGGFDPTEGFLVTQSAIEMLAQNIRRSANVGIGFAFCAGHVRAAINATRSSQT